MKKSRYFIMFIGTLFIIIIIACTILLNNIMNDNRTKTNELSADVTGNEEDTENNTEVDESVIETIEEDGYTILLRGNARPHNGEIIVEDAAKIGVEEIDKEYKIDEKGYSVEMIFLDGIATNTGTWSGHVILNDHEKYEFLVDGKDGTIELVN